MREYTKSLFKSLFFKFINSKFCKNIERITLYAALTGSVLSMILFEDKIAAVFFIIFLMGLFLWLALVYSKIADAYYIYNQQLKFYYDPKDNGFEDVATINDSGDEECEQLHAFKITMYNKSEETVKNVEIWAEQAIDSYLHPSKTCFLKLKNGTKIYKGDIGPKARELFTVCHWTGSVKDLPYNCKLMLTVKADGTDDTRKVFML